MIEPTLMERLARRAFVLALAVCLLLAACRPQQPAAQAAAPPEDDQAVERPLVKIPLAGPAAEREAEFSGMAWYGDTLVLLPQYPQRFAGPGYDAAFFTLSKAEILAYLDGRRSEPLVPSPLPVSNARLAWRTPLFQGFEAIAFAGDQVYVSIESWQGWSMMGYLMRGQVMPGLSEIRLDLDSLVRVRPQSRIFNMSEEALLVDQDWIISIYEANGAEVSPSPVAHRFDRRLRPAGEISFPHLDYRITDASALDEHGRFWAINFLHPEERALVPQWQRQASQGPSPVRVPVIERLVELQIMDDSITLTGTPPIQLELEPGRAPRNWEGIVRLEGRGFLLVTDKLPQTILGFVAHSP